MELCLDTHIEVDRSPGQVCTVMQSYCHGVMGRDSAAPCSDVPKQSGAIAHPLSHLVMEQGTFGHRDTYLSLTIDSAFKGHIDIIINVL